MTVLPRFLMGVAAAVLGLQQAFAVGTADLDLDSGPTVERVCRSGCNWQTQIGADRNERLAAAIIVDDDAVVVTGSTESTRYAGTSGWAFQVSGSGSLDWQRVVNARGSIVLEGVVARGDGTLVMVGRNFIREDSFGGHTDILLVEMTRTGEILGRWLVGGVGQQGAASVAILDDGSIVLAGYAERDQGNRAARITLIGPDRTVAWEQVVDAPYGASARDVVVAGDRIAVVGTARGEGREAFAWLRTFDRRGHVLSHTVLARGPRAAANAVAVTPDGTLAIGGLRHDGSRLTGFLSEYTVDGELQWQRDVAAPDGGDARIEDVAVARDGSLLAAGEFAEDGLLMRVADGEVEWESRYGSTTGRDSITGVAELIGGDIIATGWITNRRNGYRNTDAWVIRVDGAVTHH